jgi:hypothetical protein
MRYAPELRDPARSAVPDGQHGLAAEEAEIIAGRGRGFNRLAGIEEERS